jgi:hypothetical protein
VAAAVHQLVLAVFLSSPACSLSASTSWALSTRSTSRSPLCSLPCSLLCVWWRHNVAFNGSFRIDGEGFRVVVRVTGNTVSLFHCELEGADDYHDGFACSIRALLSKRPRCVRLHYSICVAPFNVCPIPILLLQIIGRLISLSTDQKEK